MPCTVAISGVLPKSSPRLKVGRAVLSAPSAVAKPRPFQASSDAYFGETIGLLVCL